MAYKPNKNYPKAMCSHCYHELKIETTTDDGDNTIAIATCPECGRLISAEK